MAKHEVLPKSKRHEAEVAAEWYARQVHGCTITRRATKTYYGKEDFFGCDVLGKRDDGYWVCIQVTAGDHTQVSRRKKKLEKIPWHREHDIVLLLQLHREKCGKVYRYWFKVMQYHCVGRQWFWETKTRVPVPPEWFKPVHTRKPARRKDDPQ